MEAGELPREVEPDAVPGHVLPHRPPVEPLEDAFLLWETIAIPAYNEWLAAERARKEARR